MKKLLFLILLCVLVAGGFYIGTKYGAKTVETTSTNTATTVENKVENTSTTIENKVENTAKAEEKEDSTATSNSDKMTDERYYEKAVEFVRAEKTKEEDHINTKPEYHKFVDYEGFGVAEEKGVTYAYMWIVDTAYYKENGKLEEGSGSSTAYKVKFKDGEVVSYENPTDGAGYKESIEELFPKDVAKKIMAFNYDFSKMDKIVKDYYNN